MGSPGKRAVKWVCVCDNQSAESFISYKVPQSVIIENVDKYLHCKYRSVCLFVLLFVTSGCFTEMAKCRIIQTVPCNSQGTIHASLPTAIVSLSYLLRTFYGNHLLDYFFCTHWLTSEESDFAAHIAVHTLAVWILCSGQMWTDSVQYIFVHCWINCFACRRNATVEWSCFISCAAAVIGAWLGAFPIPLDWDRPWQVAFCTEITSAPLTFTALLQVVSCS